jgi:anti-anti-sigma regulatory factor
VGRIACGCELDRKAAGTRTGPEVVARGAAGGLLTGTVYQNLALSASGCAGSHSEGGCMQGITTSESVTDIVFIRIGRHFDFRLRNQFQRACRRAQLAQARKIVVDFAHTRRLHDSGLALLMMLHDRTWWLRDGIELVNCSAVVRARFKRDVQPGTFSLA